MEEATIRLEEAQKSLRAAEEELLKAKQRYRMAKEELEAAEKAVEACEELLTEKTEAAPVLKIPVLNLSKQYMNNSKAARMLTTLGIEIGEDAVAIDVSIKAGTVTRVDVWMDDELPATSVKLQPFDAAIMDAVYTLLCSGCEIFTIDTLAKVVSGNPMIRLTPKNGEVLRSSVEKLRRINIQINCADELAKRKDLTDQQKASTFESLLLPVVPVSAEYQVNGKTTQAYKITEIPALYRYASLLHQIADIHADTLHTSKLFADTMEAILIKRYVAKRVAQIVNPKNKIRSNKVSFCWSDHGRMKGLFPELGYEMTGDSRWRSVKKRVRRIVELTLQSLQDREVITGFKEYREDGTNNPASPVSGYMVFYDSPPRLRKGGSYCMSHAT